MVMLPYKKHFLEEKIMQHVDVKNVVIGVIWGCFPLAAVMMAEFCKYIC